MKKSSLTIALLFILIAATLNSCHKGFPLPSPAKKYSSDVAVEWIKLQMKLTRTTTGFNSVVSCRSFAYAGLTLYESVVPGINNYQSIALQLGAAQLNALPNVQHSSYYWPASANAAMASITKSIFGNASVASIQSIDSLEAAFRARFQSEASSKEIENSESFGKLVASKIFEWSKSDGGHEAYANVTSLGYIPPTGPASGYLLPRHLAHRYILIGEITGPLLQVLPMQHNRVHPFPIPLNQVLHFIKW